MPRLHEKSDLSYIKQVLAEMDNPQNKVKTVHVTGTNGKGSTCYYISNLLEKAGQKTGLFVSPYIREFNERIQLNSQNISNEDLLVGANYIYQILQKLKIELVTFEYEVALAFWYFAKKRCNYAVIEVGIGARHDKTNVIIPEVSVITTVGLDHEKIIGPTLQDIAFEKAGIIKDKRPVVLGNIPDSILPIIQKEAQVKSAPMYQLNKDFSVMSEENKLLVHTKKGIYQFESRPLVEGFDIAIACQVLSLLNLSILPTEVEKIINLTKIPGRYQIIKTKPTIILDGAHNMQAMNNLLDFVNAEQNQGQIYVLITMMKDKDLSEVFALFNHNEKITLTTIDYPRAAKKADFPAEVLEKYKYRKNAIQAYIDLKKNLKVNDTLVVTGSFYLVSQILNFQEKIDAS
nr:Mur ligase family protein [Lactobacillus mulieris]